MHNRDYVRKDGTWLGEGEKLLWSGPSGLAMSATQTVNLSETISRQQNGIVLVWSRRLAADEPANDNWNYSQIPRFAGHGIPAIGAGGTNCLLRNGDDTVRKYLYIHDDRIMGHANNTSGVHLNQVLRWVVGY